MAVERAASHADNADQRVAGLREKIAYTLAEDIAPVPAKSKYEQLGLVVQRVVPRQHEVIQLSQNPSEATEALPHKLVVSIAALWRRLDVQPSAEQIARNVIRRPKQWRMLQLRLGELLTAAARRNAIEDHFIRPRQQLPTTPALPARSAKSYIPPIQRPHDNGNFGLTSQLDPGVLARLQQLSGQPAESIEPDEFAGSSVQYREQISPFTILDGEEYAAMREAFWRQYDPDDLHQGIIVPPQLPPDGREHGRPVRLPIIAGDTILWHDAEVRLGADERLLFNVCYLRKGVATTINELCELLGATEPAVVELINRLRAKTYAAIPNSRLLKYGDGTQRHIGVNQRFTLVDCRSA